MHYNNSRTKSGQVIPLLMGYSIPTAIEMEEVEQKSSKIP